MATFVIALPVFAEANPGFARDGRMPAVIGTVSAISGNTITVNGRQGFGASATTVTYTVDVTNAKVIKNNATSTVAGIVAGDTVAVQGTVSGTNITATNIRDGVMSQGPRAGMGIRGTVSAISGTSITMTGVAAPNRGTAITYTVDASSATVMKSGAASSVSNIAVGDTIIVQGTVSGTNITAKTIRDGLPQQAIQGNGEPVVAGSVTAISGSTITITNKSNVTYTIDATNAKFDVKGVLSPTISNITVGDNITVQGTVNGNAVTASSVIKQEAKTTTGNGKPKQDFMGGVFNGIGNFFKHMFGF